MTDCPKLGKEKVSLIFPCNILKNTECKMVSNTHITNQTVFGVFKAKNTQKKMWKNKL